MNNTPSQTNDAQSSDNSSYDSRNNAQSNAYQALPDLQSGLMDRLMARRQQLQLELGDVEREMASGYNRPTPS